MATESLKESPLVVIVGPTASGKTKLAIQLAREYGGEIICADSRTVYKNLDIGTAKPTNEEQALVPHWGIDLVEPGEYFSAADFQAYAVQKISEIRARQNIPFLVGGTGLYIDAVVFDYQFGPKVDPDMRAKLEKYSLQELYKHCIENNVILPENRLNKRYVIRAIEQSRRPASKLDQKVNTSIIVGIATNKDVLRSRIANRSEQLFANGVVEEAIILGKKYGWNSEAMTGNIYPLVRRYLENEMTRDELREKFTTADWRLAKRQLTYLRRNQHITWLSLTEARDYIASQLVNEQKS